MALIAARLNAGHSGGDSVAIGIYTLPLPTPPLPTLSPSLIGHPASVDVKQHKSHTSIPPSPHSPRP